VDNNTQKYFIASYLSYANIDDYGDFTYTLTTQEVWADTPEEVVGLLETHHNFARVRPIDYNNIQVLEISPKTAEEIIARSPMI